MSVLAQTTLQPEAIGVLVVLAVAIGSIVVAAAVLLRRRTRRREIEAQHAADQPDPSRFSGHASTDVLATADRALYERDGRTVAAAAMHLHEVDHPEAMAYLLHALRLAPTHQRRALLAAASSRDAEELAAHPLLAAALDEPLLGSLRDALQARRSEPVAAGRRSWKRR